MKSRVIVAVLWLTAGLGLSGGQPVTTVAQAAIAPQAFYDGKLVQLNTDRRTILVVGESPGLAFVVAETAQIRTMNSPNAKLTDLKIGDVIRVWYYVENGTRIVTQIQGQ